MTAIVGVEWEGSVYLGGERLISDSTGRIGELGSSKLFSLSNGCIAGGCGSLRAGQMLEHIISPLPKIRPKEEALKYIVRLATHIGSHLSQQIGFVDNEGGTAGEFLLGFRGRLYRFDYHGCVETARLPYQAIGSGGQVCIGALGILMQSPTFDPVAGITEALNLASIHAVGVGPPRDIMKLAPSGRKSILLGD